MTPGGIRKQTKKWTTQTGLRIRICDMSDSHLTNTIQMLERYAYHERRYIDHIFLSVPPPTAEMAEMAWDQAFAESSDDPDGTELLPDIYYNLADEQRRRNGLAEEEQS